MRILIVSNLSPSVQKPYAGIFVMNQFHALKDMLAEGDEIEIYALKRTFTSKIGSILKYLKAFVKFTPYLFKKYDVLHLHYFYPMIFICYFYKLIHPQSKLVATFHGSDAFVGEGNGLNARLMRFLAKKIDHCITVGKDLGEAVERSLKIPVKSIIPAGIDERIFYKEEIPVKYDFTFVGSFKKIKGVDLFIEAIKEMNSQSINFCFVGSGDFEDEVNELTKKYNVDYFKNLNQNELRTIYSQSKWYILTSRNEGFGLSATEAMYCGTPVLLSTNGGLREQIVDNFNGYAIEPLEVAQIVKVINKANATTDLVYEKFAHNASNFNRQYALKQVCKDILAIYKAF